LFCRSSTILGICSGNDGATTVFVGSSRPGFFSSAKSRTIESMDGGGITRLLAGKQMGTEHAPFCRGPGSWTRSHVEATTSFGGCALARSLARRQDRIRRQRVGVLLGGEAHRGRQERDGRRRLLRQPRHKLSSCLPGGKLRRSRSVLGADVRRTPDLHGRRRQDG